MALEASHSARPASLGPAAPVCYQSSMALIVDINHWLVDDDLPNGPARLRRNALRIARFIEYGAPVPYLHGRETLIECKRRPGPERCPGWM